MVYTRAQSMGNSCMLYLACNIISFKENTEEDYSECVQHVLLDSYYNQDHMVEFEQQIPTMEDNNNDQAEMQVQEEEQPTG